MNVFPTNYQAYLQEQRRAYAGCTPCPPGDWWCGALKWGCDVQHDTGGAVHKVLDFGSDNPVISKGPIQATGDSIVNAIPGGKTTDSVVTGTVFGKGLSNSLFGPGSGDLGLNLGELGKYLPYIAIGGGILLVILLIKK